MHSSDLWLGSDVLNVHSDPGLSFLTVPILLGLLFAVFHDISVWLSIPKKPAHWAGYARRVSRILANACVICCPLAFFAGLYARTLVGTPWGELVLVAGGFYLLTFVVAGSTRKYDGWQRKNLVDQWAKNGAPSSMTSSSLRVHSRMLWWGVVLMIAIEMLLVFYMRALYLDGVWKLPDAMHGAVESVFYYRRVGYYMALGMFVSFISLRLNERLLWSYMGRCGVCPNCGYPSGVRGSTRCSECGTALK